MVVVMIKGRGRQKKELSKKVFLPLDCAVGHIKYNLNIKWFSRNIIKTISTTDLQEEWQTASVSKGFGALSVNNQIVVEFIFPNL
jgi:hypothetical protein